jgi:hypothetical protein
VVFAHGQPTCGRASGSEPNASTHKRARCLKPG